MGPCPQQPCVLRRVALVAAGAGALLLVTKTISPQGSLAHLPASDIHAQRGHASGSHTDTSDQRRRLLGEIVGRNHIVRVHATQDGPRYTVCDPEGLVLEADLMAEEVYHFFPELDIKSLHFGHPEETDSEPIPLMLADPNDPF